MKLDKTLPLLGVDGQPIKEGEKELTFGDVAKAALLIEAPADPRLPGNIISGEEKMKRWLLAMRIEQAEGEFEVSVEEAAKIKQLVAIFPISYVGRCFEIIERAGKA